MKKRPTGFTLIETLAAVSLLTIAIVAPMSLASKSLSASYYARDQVTAYYLAQEALEAIRAYRDGRILQIVQNPSDPTLDIFGDIPISSSGNEKPFIVDARLTDPFSSDPPVCSGTCESLKTNGTIYGYQSGWADTNFTRTVRVTKVGGSNDELRVTVTVSWSTGAFQTRTFSISENLYRWVKDETSP